MTLRLTGYQAIEYAEAGQLPLSKYNDPTEDARQDLTPAQARKVASEDPSLIYLDVPTGGARGGAGMSLESTNTLTHCFWCGAYLAGSYTQHMKECWLYGWIKGLPLSDQLRASLRSLQLAREEDKK